MKEPDKFVIYRDAHIKTLGISLFVKKTPMGYKVANPRDALGLMGSGNSIQRVADKQFVAIVDKGRAVTILSTMRLLRGMCRAVEEAARKSMADAVDRVAKSVQKEEEWHD